MVETDGGDDRGHRPHDIRRVETAAHPDLEHGQLAPARAKAMKAMTVSASKYVGTMPTPFGGDAQLLDRAMRADWDRSSPADHPALAEIDQMRRRVETRCGTPEARRIESIVADVDPLPFVPATMIERYARSGSLERPKQRANAREPGRMPEARRESRYWSGVIGADVLGARYSKVGIGN